MPLTPEFNKEKGMWIANLDMGNRNDGYYPVNVSVDFECSRDICIDADLYENNYDAAEISSN